MKFCLFFSIGLVVSACSIFAFGTEKHLCLLNYEKINHPYTKNLSKNFSNKDGVKLIHEALPIDFIDCIKEGYEEVIILTHALHNPLTGTSKLQYLLRLPPEESDRKLIQAKSELQRDFAILDKKRRKNNCPPVHERFSGYHEDMPITCLGIYNQLAHLEGYRRKFAKLPEDYPLYKSEYFLKAPFLISYKIMESQLPAARTKSLKLIGCSPKEVLLGYPELKKLIDDFDIHFDATPKQRLQSAIRNKHVSVLDSRWARESLQAQNQQGFFANIKINTALFYRWGERTVLRGKYKVKLRGFGLGVGEKWSQVYIKNSDVEGMEVNETRMVTSAKFDPYIAAWANLELQVGSYVKVLGTSETNSWGVGFGLLQELEITRLY